MTSVRMAGQGSGRVTVLVPRPGVHLTAVGRTCHHARVDEDDLDFAVAAWREEGRWQVSSLQPRVLESLDRLTAALQALPGEGGTLGLISVAEEFFLIVRVQGETTRLFLSDLACAFEWDIAEAAAEALGIDLAEEEDEVDDLEPVGDFAIVADFGMPAEELEVLCEDPDLYPEDQISAIATRLGFADQLDAELGE
jgi:putative tRNA adenosine deaminase-associated protein